MNDIKVNQKTIEFLERHQDLINSLKMQDLYDLFLKEYVYSYPTRFDILPTNQLTYVFLKAGINPLPYMNSVPKGYASNLNLDEVIIPSCITIIDDKAFVGNPSLAHLELTDSVRKIAKSAFGSIMAKCDINYIGSIDNYISTKNIGQLSTLTTTLYINGSKPVIIDIHSAKRIEDATFYCNEDVETLNLGKQIKYIGWNAFNHCKNLSKIVYDGIVDEFNAIDIKPKAFLDVKTDTITCLDGEISIDEI